MDNSPTPPEHSRANSEADDADLVLRSRSGDEGAFGELWRRHYPSGLTVARSITRSIDPEDLVQESYARIYQAILRGRGPNGSFRAYLFTSIRNTAAAWGRARREDAIEELDSVPDPASTEPAANDALDRGLTAQAFRSLPTRWQEVLWYTEIERLKPAEAAPLLGMAAGAVAQLAFRAREGLRAAWIQAHLRDAEAGSECLWTIEHLGAHSLGKLGVRHVRRIELHISECPRCTAVAAEAREVSGRLALAVLPLVLGTVGAAQYLAAVKSAHVTPTAVAMPHAVIHTEAGMVSSGGTVATTTQGGSAGTLGLVVAAGSASLVIASVVAAAAVIPGLAVDPADTFAAGSTAFASPAPQVNEIVPSHLEETLPELLIIEIDESRDEADTAPIQEVTRESGSHAPGTDFSTEPGTPQPDDDSEPGVEIPAEPILPAPVDPSTPVEPEPSEPVIPPELPLTWEFGEATTTLKRVSLAIEFHGTPGAEVRYGVGHVDHSVTLDEEGTGTGVVRIGLLDLVRDHNVIAGYVVDGVTDAVLTEPVSSLVPADWWAALQEAESAEDEAPGENLAASGNGPQSDERPAVTS